VAHKVHKPPFVFFVGGVGDDDDDDDDDDISTPSLSARASLSVLLII
jgi:hypothetical protein